MKPLSIFSFASPSVVVRSAFFFVGQFLSTLLIGPAMVLARSAPFETRYGLANRWVRFNLWLLKAVCGLGYEVEGREHIPPGAGLILCKHQSAFETLALQAIFPPVVFILKQELLRIPVWGWAMATQEPIAIDRGARTHALKQILRDGEARIRAGRWVVLFPEGTRVAPGVKGTYGGSGGMLAQRAACAVVPVAHNAGEYWTKNGFLKFPGTIQVRIGSPLDGAALTGGEINRRAEAWIEGTMAEISGAGPYALRSGRAEASA
jgi:1-acyl-sn-glycerol-3-phosphate acyltransferase